MASSAKKGIKCAQCNKDFGKKDGSTIQCDACNEWFHSACQNVPDDHCEVFGKYDSVKWYCEKCNKSVEKLWTVITQITVRHDKVEEEIDKIKKGITRLETDNQSIKLSNSTIGKKIEEIMEGKLPDALIARIGKEIEKVTKSVTIDLGTVKEDLKKVKSDTEQKIVAAIETKLEEGVRKPSFASIVAQQVDSQFTKVSGDLNKVQQVLEETKKMADEEKDREGRSNNIIMYRVPECSTAEGRVKHDKSFSVELFNTVMELDVKEEDLKSIFRLGKWDSSNSTSRPLLIQFREKAIKNRVMESLSKLKNASDRFKNLSICKRLVEEAKQKESDDQQGEFIWRVRGLPGQLKLIRFRKH